MTARITSLDQFRGYTVLGMCVVNFLGDFAAIPAVFKHRNTYCSYADTIMPHFFFAVGFAYRLTYLRQMAHKSAGDLVARFFWRNLKLIAIGATIKASKNMTNGQMLTDSPSCCAGFRQSPCN